MERMNKTYGHVKGKWICKYVIHKSELSIKAVSERSLKI